MDQAPVREVPETHPASRVYRIFTGMFVFGPPALLVASFRKRWFLATPTNRCIFGVSYLLSGFGITAGYHRLPVPRVHHAGSRDSDARLLAMASRAVHA
jgi:fatty-acid desaturase